MTAPTVTRAQAICGARAALDAALDRIARDRAAGRLAPDAVERINLAERRYARQHPPTGHRAAA